jgi:hypothetical protein
MRPALTLPREFAIRVLTGYVPLNTARNLVFSGGSAMDLEASKVIRVETNGKMVTIK